MFSIPQSTSFVLVFKAYLSSDHITEATGKTIAITISKAGGAFGNPNAGATNATEISSGWYKVTLDATDTGTLGVLAVRGAAATIDDFGDRMYVVKATNGGLTALPDTAVTTNASLVTSGTGTAQLSVSSGLVTLAGVTHTGAVIPTVSAVTGLTASNLDATISSRMATYTQPTGFLAATFPTGTVANTTNITAGTITTTTNLTTNNDKTGYALTSGERNSVADAMLDRDMSTGADNGSTTVRTPRQALRFLRNKFAIVAGTLTVYKEDDTAASWTSTIVTTAGNPVSSSDPAG